MLPVSVVLDGQYGLKNLALSIPSIVGRSGLEEILEISLSREEGEALYASARQLEDVIQSLEIKEPVGA